MDTQIHIKHSTYCIIIWVMVLLPSIWNSKNTRFTGKLPLSILRTIWEWNVGLNRLSVWDTTYLFIFIYSSLSTAESSDDLHEWMSILRHFSIYCNKYSKLVFKVGSRRNRQVVVTGLFDPSWFSVSGHLSTVSEKVHCHPKKLTPKSTH